MAKKKVKVEKEVSLESILFSCRDDLRGKAPMVDKRDMLLTLVFLKFVNDRFDQQQKAIVAEYKDKGMPDDFINMVCEKPAEYKKAGVFYLPEECKWSTIVTADAKNKNLVLDNAIKKLEDNEEKLKGALPQGIFVRCNLEGSVIKAVVDDITKIDPEKFKDKDLIGRVYEYFLQAFSINADKEEGEFYTPHSIVELIASLIEPFDGTLYDPCCGSGGMFVQSSKMMEAHGLNKITMNVYGQESEPSTFRLAKMNLAVRGISYHLGDSATSTFTHDHHKDVKVDYIMANPPFNLKKWWDDKLVDDVRWKGYGTPPASNANYAWILHILNKLNVTNGVAGFLLANGALDDSDTLTIRQKLIEQDKVEAIIVLPREMFYSTDISVTLWVLNNNKKGGPRHERMLRNREKEVLFVDLRTWNQNIYEKKYVKLSEEQIADVCKIYFDWQTTAEKGKYAKPELYYSATLDEISQKGYSLVPSRYIEFVDRDTEMDYEEALKDAGAKVKDLLARQAKNREDLLNAFKTIGYDAK